jgi:UDP-glucose 4-epimerase
LNMRDSHWVVLGGAGYIGAHVVRELCMRGARVTVVDDLSTGIVERLPESCRLVVGDAGDAVLLTQVLSREIDGVAHFAAKKQARESIRRPTHYWLENLRPSIALLEAISATNVRKLLFSSSCAVYGSAGFVDEFTAIEPVSPYGWTKMVAEKMYSDAAAELGLAVMILRYFNVIGNGDFPHAHDMAQESLIPAVFRTIKSGAPPRIFGRHHDTKDGTCVRDYIDVRDLAEAHTLGVEALMEERIRGTMTLNLSSGRPSSVLDVVREVGRLAGQLEPVFEPAKEGDPAKVWGVAGAAREVLGWVPRWRLADSVSSHDNSVRRWQEPFLGDVLVGEVAI